jgi:hypothetical protein
MLLIYPPVAKPSEPPAGISKLSGALLSYGVKHRILDANIEGLLHLLQHPHAVKATAADRWTSRALRDRFRNLESLRDWRSYRVPDRYKRMVHDLNRVLRSSGVGTCRAGLANYEDRELSPLRSADLVRAAENPEGNLFYPYFEKRLTGILEKEKPSIVGFSLNFLSQALCAFSMIGFLRSRRPELTIILGGGLVTSWMKRPGWKDPFQGLVDRLVAGPGEIPLLSLAGIDRAPCSHVTPVYDSLPLDHYLSPGLIVPYSGSRGCSWRRCSFCPERAERNAYVPVQTDSVLADLQAIVKRSKPVLVHLLDNAISTELLRALSGSPLNAPWYGFVRITPSLTDIDFCKALKASGCVMLKLGLESGDQAVLDELQKGIELGTASLALKTLKKAGIATYVYLLFGTPPEASPSARKTLEFTARHSDDIDFLNVAIFNMPLFGPETHTFKTRTFYEGDLSLYTEFSHPKEWNRRRVRRFLNTEFRRDRAISAILKRDPVLFTSNHAPFFVMART